MPRVNSKQPELQGVRRAHADALFDFISSYGPTVDRGTLDTLLSYHPYNWTNGEIRQSIRDLVNEGRIQLRGRKTGPGELEVTIPEPELAGCGKILPS